MIYPVVESNYIAPLDHLLSVSTFPPQSNNCSPLCLWSTFHTGKHMSQSASLHLSKRAQIDRPYLT
jgi:hypothetical protein